MHEVDLYKESNILPMPTLPKLHQARAVNQNLAQANQAENELFGSGYATTLDSKQDKFCSEAVPGNVACTTPQNSADGTMHRPAAAVNNFTSTYSEAGPC